MGDGHVLSVKLPGNPMSFEARKIYGLDPLNTYIGASGTAEWQQQCPDSGA